MKSTLSQLESKSLHSILLEEYADDKTEIYKGFVIDANDKKAFHSKDEVDAYLKTRQLH